MAQLLLQQPLQFHPFELVRQLLDGGMATFVTAVVTVPLSKKRLDWQMAQLLLQQPLQFHPFGLK